MISEDFVRFLEATEDFMKHSPSDAEVKVLAVCLIQQMRQLLCKVRDLEVHADRLSYRLNEAVRAIDEISPKTVYSAEKFRRPKGDFLRVFQGGAIKE